MKQRYLEIIIDGEQFMICPFPMELAFIDNECQFFIFNSKMLKDTLELKCNNPDFSTLIQNEIIIKITSENSI